MGSVFGRPDVKLCPSYNHSHTIETQLPRTVP
jgi:hypothetical protein